MVSIEIWSLLIFILIIAIIVIRATGRGWLHKRQAFTSEINFLFNYLFYPSFITISFRIVEKLRGRNNNGSTYSISSIDSTKESSVNQSVSSKKRKDGKSKTKGGSQFVDII